MFSVEWLLFFLTGLSVLGGLFILAALLVYASKTKTGWRRWLKTHFMLFAGVGVGFILSSGAVASCVMLLMVLSQATLQRA